MPFLIIGIGDRHQIFQYTLGWITLLLIEANGCLRVFSLTKLSLMLMFISILINNGRILRDNLKRMGRDERWLQKQVQQRGTQCIEDVYLLMMNDAGQIYFAAKERR